MSKPAAGIRILGAFVPALALAAAFLLTSGAANIDHRPIRIIHPSDESAILQVLRSGVNGSAGARARSVHEIQAAIAGESVTGSVAYYDVDGGSREELRRSITEARGRYTHADYDANTEWRIHYTYSPGDPSTGRPPSFTTAEAITITMPHWRERSTAAPALAKAWDEYMRNLVFHEEGHYLIDEACLAAMRSRVSQLPIDAPFSDVDALCKRTMRDYGAMNVDYDKVTDHGATQGASF